MQADCIVIGGGLVGLFTARELARHGTKVIIIERGRVGQECSWAGGGILSPIYPWREPTALAAMIRFCQKEYPLLAQDLYEETGIDPEWLQSGMLLLEEQDKEQAADWAAASQATLELLNVEQLSAMEPHVKGHQGNALRMPEVGQIRNSRLIPALQEHLINLGAVLLEHTEVHRIRLHNNSVQAVETTNSEYSAAITIIANGAWGSGLLPALAIRPVRGQMICYQATPGYLRHILLKNNVYVIPRRDGHILVGSTVEDVGFDKGTTEAAKTLLAGAAEAILPGMNQFPLVGHWSGLRPATQSGLPYVCKHPAINGLYLNIGHHRNGILLAPGSARLLTDIILEGETAVPSKPFQFQPESI
jgi:glycine oxidase